MPTLVEIAIIILLVLVTSIVSFKGGVQYGYIQALEEAGITKVEETKFIKK